MLSELLERRWSVEVRDDWLLEYGVTLEFVLLQQAQGIFDLTEEKAN